MLNPSDLVPCRAVVLGNFGLDDDQRIELVRNDEVGCLIEAGHSFGSLGLAEAYTGMREHTFDRRFQNVSHQLAY